MFELNINDRGVQAHQQVSTIVMRKISKKANVGENISSDTLFHFTSSLERVKDIIKNGFKTHYSFEKIPGAKTCFYVVPTVCFCDIPLGSIKQHLQAYGRYGLGISKRICKSKGINPVFYVHFENRIFHNIAINDLRTNATLPYIKLHDGKNHRLNIGNYSFYDEREWRYVQATEGELLEVDRCEAGRICKERNKDRMVYLQFRPEEFRYVIVDSERKIPEMIAFADEELNISPAQKRMLHSRIIVAENITLDF